MLANLKHLPVCPQYDAHFDQSHILVASIVVNQIPMRELESPELIVENPEWLITFARQRSTKVGKCNRGITLLHQIP